MGKERRSHLSARQWQIDHGACLELVQNSLATRALHMEAQPISSVVISMAKGQSTYPEADAVIFTTGAKLWHGMAVKSTNQRKYPLDGCIGWKVSADLPSIIKETRPRP